MRASIREEIINFFLKNPLTLALVTLVASLPLARRVFIFDKISKVKNLNHRYLSHLDFIGAENGNNIISHAIKHRTEFYLHFESKKAN